MKNKYPELYSDEFIDFCKTKIIPLCNKNFSIDIDNVIFYKSPVNNSQPFFFIIFTILVVVSFVNPVVSSISIILFFILYLFISTILSIKKCLTIKNNTKINLQNIKDVIYPKLFSFYKDCQYCIESENIFKLTTHIKKTLLFKIFPELYIFRVEDMFKLNYKNLEIELCELFFDIDNRDNIKQSIKEMINIGPNIGCNIFLKIKNNRINNEETIIIQNNFINTEHIKSENIIKLENEDFNKKFWVYSTSQIEARKILTPATMINLLSLYSNSKLKSINISFEKEFINILISTKQENHFEPTGLFYQQDSNIINCLREIILEQREFLNIIDLLYLRK